MVSYSIRTKLTKVSARACAKANGKKPNDPALAADVPSKYEIEVH